MRRTLTAAERGLAVPDVQAGRFPAGLPQGQVVLVVGRDPGRAQHSSQVQTQRQEDAHQPHQLQRGQHRHAHLLHAAARRSHAPGAAAGRPAGGEDARRVRRAVSSTSLGGKEPRRRARGLALSGLRASGRGEGGSAGEADRGGGRLQLQRRRSRHGPSPPVPRRALPAPAPPRRSLASSAPAPPRAAGGGTERGGAALLTSAA